MKNAISWFEIPSTQLDQAQAFYEAVLVCSRSRRACSPGTRPAALLPMAATKASPSCCLMTPPRRMATAKFWAAASLAPMRAT